MLHFLHFLHLERSRQTVERHPPVDKKLVRRLRTLKFSREFKGLKPPHEILDVANV